MKKVFLFSFVVFMTTTMSVFAQDDIMKARPCNHCGMDREKFSSSRMLLQYDDATTAASCSLHCAALDLATALDKAPQAILVADYNTRKLIDAEKAVWVVGGDRPGVMTKRPKWAFADKSGAETFIKEHGGEPVTFEEAIRFAYDDLYQDTKMIRDKRKMMKAKGAHQ